MKPLIVGLNNPLSNHPDDALVPWPRGCTGHRLLNIIRETYPEFTEQDFLSLFERTNLWRQRKLPSSWGATAALKREGARIRSISKGRAVVILLGARVSSVVFGKYVPPWTATNLGGTLFYSLPHPSGRSALYNDLSSRRKAAEILMAACGRLMFSEVLLP